jgi:DNA-directed RNA polymerase specialized sigma24 family protein
MSTSVPRRQELDSEKLPGKRSSTSKEFLESLRLYERDLYRAAWALCDRTERIDDVLERAIVLTWEDQSHPSLNQPLRQQLSRRLIEVGRLMRETIAAGHGIDFTNIGDGQRPSAELSAHVHAAIHSLPWDCREAFVLRDVMGFTGLQCAEILRISHADVRQLISNARLRMTQELSTPISNDAAGGAQ